MTIQIPEELSVYVESLMYESEARKDLCAFMIDHDMSGSESFKKYHKEYMEFYAQYQTAKNELSAKYNLGGHKWRLDFHTNIITVED